MGGQQMSGGKFRMKASVLSFRAAVVMVVAGHDLGYRDGHHRRSFHVSGPCTSQPARLGVAISVRHLLSSASANRPRPLGFLTSLDLDRGNSLSYGWRRLGVFRIHNRQTNCRARFASYSRRHASICMDRFIGWNEKDCRFSHQPLWLNRVLPSDGVSSSKAEDDVGTAVFASFKQCKRSSRNVAQPVILFRARRVLSIPGRFSLCNRIRWRHNCAKGHQLRHGYLPAIEAVGIDIVLLSLFVVQHSLMARQSFKKWALAVLAVAPYPRRYLANYQPDRWSDLVGVVIPWLVYRATQHVLDKPL